MRNLFRTIAVLATALPLLLPATSFADAEGGDDVAAPIQDLIRIPEGQGLPGLAEVVIGSSGLSSADHNAAHIHQRGFSNFFIVRQEGSGNLLVTVQEGIGNTGSAAQVGNDNRALIKQHGIGNSAEGITQIGNGHIAIVKQFGHGNRAPKITQTPGAPPVVVTQR